MRSRLVEPTDATVVVVAAVLSFLLVDLFPGPMTALTLATGAVGAAALLRGHHYGRRLIDVAAGLFLALIALLVLALLQR